MLEHVILAFCFYVALGCIVMGVSGYVGFFTALRDKVAVSFNGQSPPAHVLIIAELIVWPLTFLILAMLAGVKAIRFLSTIRQRFR